MLILLHMLLVLLIVLVIIDVLFYIVEVEFIALFVTSLSAIALDSRFAFISEPNDQVA